MRPLPVPLLCLLAACATAPPPSSGTDLPGWVDNPYFGHEKERDGLAIIAVGVSDLAATDESAGRADGEADARNKVAAEMQTLVSRLLERTNLAMKDYSQDAVLGQKVARDIAEQLTRQTLIGARATDYFYYPSRDEPRKIYVRMVLSVESSKLAHDLEATIAEQIKDKLGAEHEQALGRLHQAVERAIDQERR